MANLVTLQQVKSFLGEQTALMDDELSTLIAAASQQIRRHVDPIEYTSYAGELLDGYGKPWVMVSHFPLKPGDTERIVRLNGIDITTECRFEESTGRIYRAGGFPTGVQNIAVTYSAGYGPTVPEDLRAACLMLVKFYVKSDLLARSVFFEGGGGMGAERAMPMQVRAILESYPSYRP